MASVPNQGPWAGLVEERDVEEDISVMSIVKKMSKGAIIQARGRGFGAHGVQGHKEERTGMKR